MQESTVCEDDLASWQAYGKNSVKIRETPDITEGRTSGMKTEIIGAGPIFIKKSTEFHSAKRNIRDDVSDTTYITNIPKTTQQNKKTKIHAIKERASYKRKDSEITTGTEATYIPG